MTTHRVVNITNQSGELQFRTKGDANEAADETPVAPGQVVGVVAFTIPALGHLIQSINTDLGLFAMVVVPGLLFVINEVYAWIRNHQTSPSESISGGRE